MSRELRGTLAVLGAAAGYSTLPILGKLALAEGVGVLPMVAWRFILASAFVWTVLGVTRLPAPPRRDWPGLVALGVLYATSATAYLTALQWVSASLASLIFFTYPAVVIILAAIFLREPLTGRRATATVLAMGGCGLIIGFEGQQAESAGILLILLGVAAIAVYILAGRVVLRRTPAYGAAAVSLLATGVVATAVALSTGGLRLGGSTAGTGIVVLMALVATAVPVTLLLAGIREIGAGHASIIATIEPFLTLLLAAGFLGERIRPMQYAGGALLLGGILWIRLLRPRTDPAESLHPPPAPRP